MPLVLVVEDEPILRSTVVRALSRMPGLEVIDAGTISDGLALAFAQRPDMIISDIDLPDGSGIEMISVLAARGTRVPTVFVTAFLREFGSRVPLDPGITVLEKPVPIDTLRDLVRSSLGTADITPLDSAFSVADYVQLAAVSNRSISLVVTVGGVREGTIHFVNGEAWAAFDRYGDGEAAFDRLVELPQAECVPGRAPDTELVRNLFDSATSMLLRSWTGTAADHTPSAESRHESTRQTGSHPVVVSIPTPSSSPAIGAAEPAATNLAADEGVGVMVEATEQLEDKPRTRFDELKEEGLEALLSRDYEAAAAALEAAAELQPDDALVRANLNRLATLRSQSGAF